MKSDDEARRFVAEGLNSYRDVALAMKEFQEQTKLAMRQVLEEFADRFAALGCFNQKADDFTFPIEPSIEAERFRNGLWIGIGIQTKVNTIDAYAFVRVSSGAAREAVCAHLDKAALGDWRQNYESPRSYLWRSISPDRSSEIFTILQEGLRILFDELWQVPEFRVEFQRPNHPQN